jgi:hypothetical protein
MNQVTVKRRAFFARTGNLLSTENPTFSARMMVAIVSNRGLAPGASVFLGMFSGTAFSPPIVGAMRRIVAHGAGTGPPL